MIRFVPRSIRARLALYILLLLAILATALLTSVYLSARRSVWRSFRESLTAEARSLASMMEYERTGSFDIETPDSSLSHVDVVSGSRCYRVFDRLGKSLVLSASLTGDVELWKPTPNWFAKAELGDAIFRKIRLGGEERELLTLKCLPRIEPAEEQDGEGEVGTEEMRDAASPGTADLERAAVVVQVAGTTAPVRDLLARLRVILLIGGLLTLAASTLGSLAVACVGLRPIQRLASSVQEIREDTLGTRVPQARLPKELIPLADKTNEMLSRIETAFQREKRFTSDAAHEIRTPLTALTTAIEVALRKERSPREYMETLTACLSSAKSLKQLTDSLLLLAALDAGKVLLRPRPLDIQKFLHEIVRVHADAANRKGIRLAANVALPEAMLEADLLAPILNNLVSNAVEYGRPGDSVSISAHRRDSQAALCIEVADTGPGIAKSDIEKLFYRFYRGRQEGDSETTHAGLGLAIAAKAAEAMGGRIEAESEPGKGSTFRLIIP